MMDTSADGSGDSQSVSLIGLGVPLQSFFVGVQGDDVNSSRVSKTHMPVPQVDLVDSTGQSRSPGLPGAAEDSVGRLTDSIAKAGNEKERSLSSNTNGSPYLQDEGDFDDPSPKVGHAKQHRFIRPHVIEHHVFEGHPLPRLSTTPSIKIKRQGRIFEEPLIIPSTCRDPSNADLNYSQLSALISTEETFATPLQSPVRSHAQTPCSIRFGIVDNTPHSPLAVLPGAESTCEGQIDRPRSRAERRASAVPLSKPDLVMRSKRESTNADQNSQATFEDDDIGRSEQDIHHSTPHESLHDIHDFLICLYAHPGSYPRIMQQSIKGKPCEQSEATPSADITTRGKQQSNLNPLVIPAEQDEDGSTQGWLDDDAVLFRILMRSYRLLRPVSFRLFSARTVRRIIVSWPGSEYSSSNLSSEAMELFKHPSRGKGKMRFVRLVHACSSPHPSRSAKPVSSPPFDDNQFVFQLEEGFNPARIGLALAFVMILSAAGVVLWVIFGLDCSLGECVRSNSSSSARVPTGMLIGGLTLFMGWTVVVGWVGLSWMIE